VETWKEIKTKKVDVEGQVKWHDIDTPEGMTENGRGPGYRELADRVKAEEKWDSQDFSTMGR